MKILNNINPFEYIGTLFMYWNWQEQWDKKTLAQKVRETKQLKKYYNVQSKKGKSYDNESKRILRRRIN